MNILITGAGGPAAICAYKSLVGRGYNIFMADMDPMSAGLYLVKKGNCFLLPAGNKKEFIPITLSLCAEKKIDLLIPTVDTELLPVAGRIKDFEALGCKVMVSPKETLKVCLDKFFLMEACCNKVALGAYKTFEEFFTKFDLHGKKWIAKPRKGSGSRDIHVIKNEEQILKLACFRDKNFMTQEYLEGKEYSVDVMIDKDGKVCAVVARERMRTDSGVVITSRVVKNEAIVEYVISVLGCLNLRFAANVQVIDTLGRGPLLLEINPRFSGGLSLVVAAGVNIPLMCVQNILLNRPFQFAHRYKELAMVRFFEEKFFNPSQFLAKNSEVVFTGNG